jgi:hypothetical protein
MESKLSYLGRTHVHLALRPFYSATTVADRYLPITFDIRQDKGRDH